MKIYWSRFVITILHTMNGFLLASTLIYKDYLLSLGSLALFLILFVNDPCIFEDVLPKQGESK